MGLAGSAFESRIRSGTNRELKLWGNPEVRLRFKVRQRADRRRRTKQLPTMTTIAPASTSNGALALRPTQLAGAALSTVVLLGTVYSVLFDTALDTSNPLNRLHTRHDGQTAYFAQKSNLFNTVFVKRAWGWTTAAFLSLFFTAPIPIWRSGRRLQRWTITTGVWLVFAAWFFGPSLFDRLNVLSGAQCLVRLPNTIADANTAEGGTYVVVANEYCDRRAILTPSSHPSLFASIPELQNALAGTASVGGNAILETLKLRPKLYRGHDISGHLFLITLAVLFLADQLTPSLRLLFPSHFPSPSPALTSTPISGSTAASTSATSQPELSKEKDELPPPTEHVYAVYFTLALTGLWLFMALTTSVFFHTVAEKVTGFGTY